MNILQILVWVFILFAISRAVLRFREGTLTSKEFIIWDLFWIVAGIVFLFPNITNKIAKILGVGRGTDATIYVALLVLFYMIFRLYIKLEDLDHNITKIVRAIAINSKDNIKQDK